MYKVNFFCSIYQILNNADRFFCLCTCQTSNIQIIIILYVGESGARMTPCRALGFSGKRLSLLTLHCRLLLDLSTMNVLTHGDASETTYE